MKIKWYFKLMEWIFGSGKNTPPTKRPILRGKKGTKQGEPY
jgi:hypothetical protein